MQSRTLSFLVAVLVLLFSGASCSSDGDDVSSTTLTEEDTTSEVNLAAHEEFTVRLISNPSAGYSWQIAEMSTSGIAEFQMRTYEEIAEDNEIVGAAGVEEFTFKAGRSGAGILRFEYARPADDAPVPERVVEYILRIDGAPWPAPRDDSPPPAVTSATVPTPAGDLDPPAIDVSALFDGEGARDAVVGGTVFQDEASTRLCQVLMESFPPQCGGHWVVVANPDKLDMALETSGERSWTQGRVEIAGRFDGERFVVGSADSTIEPTASDLAFTAAFVTFASEPSSETAAAVPLASEVALGLGPEILSTAVAAELERADTWSLDRDEFRAYGGPFSALDVAASPYMVTIGAHARCVGVPEPAPVGFEQHRRVSLQPTLATSCLEWWTIDFFLNDTGQIAAVTLDLFGP